MINKVDELEIDSLEKGKTHQMWLHLIDGPMADSQSIPVIIARGKTAGKTMGITAAVHGNEINGIPVIQKLMREIDATKLTGNIVAVPVVNLPSFIRKKRRFVDNVDLNHIMPGNKKGNASGVYAYRFFDKIIKNIDYLLDLHTASFGRINSYYIRADMRHGLTAKLAKLQNAQIIVHNPPADGTLRGAASALKIPSITLEVGNPNTFQKGVVRSSLTGIYNALIHLNMWDDVIDRTESPAVLCSNSYWIYTDKGGILSVIPQTAEIVEKGQKIAVLKDIFGNLVKEFYSPEKGIVIGKSVSPVNQSGGRILHLGIMKNK